MRVAGERPWIYTLVRTACEPRNRSDKLPANDCRYQQWNTHNQRPPTQAIRNATPPRDKNRRSRNFSNLSAATRSVKTRGTMEGHSRFARLNHPPPVGGPRLHRDYVAAGASRSKPASLRGSARAAKIKNAASTNFSPVVDSEHPPRGTRETSREFRVLCPLLLRV